MFDRVFSHIEDSLHSNIYAHLTINALNWQEIPELVKLLNAKVKGITFQFHYPYEDIDQELFLPNDKRKLVLDELILLKQRGFSIAVSYACLNALKTNSWKCQPWMIASADPNGRLTHGCYVKNRGKISCQSCGFSAHTEISLAYSGVPESMIVGNRIFHTRST